MTQDCNKVVGKGDAGLFANTACFATDVYTGNGGTLTRNTGIDNTKALVWIKEKEGDGNHVLFDTDRGVGNALNSDRGNKQNYDAEYLQAFNDNGFTLGNHRLLNYPGSKFVAWNFRAAPGFFDVVTFEGEDTQYPGNPTQLRINSLGSELACISTKTVDNQV